MRNHSNCPNRSQAGTSLIETLFAVAMCTIVVFALAGLVTAATRQSKDTGISASQATAFGAQKLDDFMRLDFSGATLTAGGTGAITDANYCTANTSFCDYLTIDGTATTSTAANLYFTRRWQITDVTTTLKRIDILVQPRAIGTAVAPTIRMSTMKSDPLMSAIL